MRSTNKEMKRRKRFRGNDRADVIHTKKLFGLSGYKAPKVPSQTEAGASMDDALFFQALRIYNIDFDSLLESAVGGRFVMDPPSKQESAAGTNRSQKMRNGSSLPPPPPTYSVPRIECTKASSTKEEAKLLHPKRQLNLNVTPKAHRLKRTIRKRRVFRPIKSVKLGFRNVGNVKLGFRNISAKPRYEVHQRHCEAKTPPPSSQLQPQTVGGRNQTTIRAPRAAPAPLSLVKRISSSSVNLTSSSSAKCTSSSFEVGKSRPVHVPVHVPEVDLLESAEALLSLRGL
uniref:Uncharacterized protein n=2 Tax=Lotharella oceanica TaxID=641309 RepID=A0A7S2TTB6_9EUKA|mmetsp:Transcript_26096/g.48656  ORF Transcript_26096/g.48656 Transcript_26096/m.48656 type:complete len:286 (+) Transcript_26096:178-1035(+)|eukprot:CAMPEP_0170168450 /NCGR_PEP_ID=MMETSP0040_2-20121228/1482_1 /TAXON_ID=641309 /ORGANISM="Lotharella oceanica, Strain CCMP622" /LENGTH=285 /DNA_ID=CAMNT_0010406705 /DNA_START=138 /DNA_END=995 /DNA_ORIENTATION=+